MQSPLLIISSPYKKVPLIWVLPSNTPTKHIQKKLKIYLRNLPKKEDTKANRKLTVNINKKFQQVTGLSSFYLSIWKNTYYKVTCHD